MLTERTPPPLPIPDTGLPMRSVTSLSRKIVEKDMLSGNHHAECTVSIVIPCYNYAGYLKQAVDSTLSQTGVIVDVVIVDDASTDSSLAIARALCESDARVRVVAHARNQGPVQTFNDGLELADGEFLVRLDSDDLLTPGSLARSVAVMRRYPSVGLVYGHPLHFSGSNLPKPRINPTYWTVWPGRDWLHDRCQDGYNVITSPEVLMRKSVVDQTGGQRNLDHTHDMEMWFRISAYSDIAYIHGVDQAWHREHPNSLSALHVDNYKDLVERQKAFDVLFTDVRNLLPDAETYRSSAMKAIANQAIEFACRELDRGRLHDSVDSYVDFARSIVPKLDSLPGWRGLERRISQPSWSRWYPASIAGRLGRRWRHILRMRRWRQSGVF